MFYRKELAANGVQIKSVLPETNRIILRKSSLPVWHRCSTSRAKCLPKIPLNGRMKSKC